MVGALLPVLHMSACHSCPRSCQMDYKFWIPFAWEWRFIHVEAKGDERKGEWEGAERELWVISICILSTACTVRQPVCPNKQPTEGGTPHYNFPPLSHLEFTFHLTINTGPRLRPCPLSVLEFRCVSEVGKATFHVLFSTYRWQHNRSAASWERRRRHNVNSCFWVLGIF